MEDSSAEVSAMHAWADTLARSASPETLSVSLGGAVARLWERMGLLLGETARARVIERACRIAANRCPPLATVSATSEGMGFEDFGLAASVLRSPDRAAAVRVLLAELAHAADLFGGSMLAQTLRSDAAPQDSAPSGNPGVEVERLRARLRCLHAVSAHLATFESLEITIPNLLADLATVLPVRGAALLEHLEGQPCLAIWHTRESSSVRLAAAESHIRSAYAWMLGSAHGVQGTESRLIPLVRPESPGRAAADGANGAAPEYVTLPLASERAPLAGILQLDLDGPVSGDDLEFLGTVTTQLASALDRHHAGRGGATPASERTEAVTRAHREFVAVVSHDLRNPLSAILMSVALLLRSHKSGPGHKQLEVIKRSSERMNQLIQNVVDAASLESGLIGVDPQPQDILPIITESMRLLQGTASSKSVRLETDVGTDVVGVLADRDRLVQCLSNVINTGLRFVTKGGAITVRAHRSARDVLFSVSDTGPGLAPADIDQVFDRRWWVSRNSSLSTGIGLAVAKGIVEAHGGRMWVDSTLGVGTTISFTLPPPASAEPVLAIALEPESA